MKTRKRNTSAGAFINYPCAAGAGPQSYNVTVAVPYAGN